MVDDNARPALSALRVITPPSSSKRASATQASNAGEYLLNILRIILAFFYLTTCEVRVAFFVTLFQYKKILLIDSLDCLSFVFFFVCDPFCLFHPYNILLQAFYEVATLKLHQSLYFQMVL